MLTCELVGLSPLKGTGILVYFQGEMGRSSVYETHLARLALVEQDVCRMGK